MNRIIRMLFLGLSGKIRLVICVCFLVTLLVLGIFIYSHLEQNQIALYQAKLRNMTSLIYDMTELYVKNSVKRYLTGIAEKTRSLAGYYQEQAAAGKMTIEQAKAAFKSLVLSAGYGKIGDTGYIAALDSNGMATIHPKTGVEGTSLGHLEVMQKVIQMKNGYIHYWWKNPDDAAMTEKAAAIAYFADWDMIIWVTSYKLDTALLIDRQELHDNIVRMKIGSRGYPFIMDSRGKLIMHPDPAMEGMSIYTNTDAGGKKYIAGICAGVQEQAELTHAYETEEGPAAAIQGAVIEEADEQAIGLKTVFYPGEDPGAKNPSGRMAAYVWYRDMDWVILSSIATDEVYSNINIIRDTSIWIVIVAFLVSNIVIAFFIHLLLKPIAQIKSVGALVSRGDLSKRLEVASNDEIAEIAEQFNSLLDNFQNVLTRIRKSTAHLLDSVQGLSVSSQQIAGTSNEQAAAVKEIVSTMEDSDTLARSIAEKVEGVTAVANRMKSTVAEGVQLVKGSLIKMDEIKKANAETIIEVQTLSGKIGSIWEIVKIINSIADQTRIIAFNAELEASAAGEAGRNFQIVATEIRRLADSTVASTGEIRTRITEIQHSSDNLILSSEGGTSRIREGWNLANDMQEVFAAILRSSEFTAGSASQIARSINQQVAAFDQILLTLKQISEGIDNFVSSTRMTTREAEKIRKLADSLDASVSSYATVREEKVL